VADVRELFYWGSLKTKTGEIATRLNQHEGLIYGYGQAQRLEDRRYWRTYFTGNPKASYIGVTDDYGYIHETGLHSVS
jgi:hypothetical protein